MPSFRFLSAVGSARVIALVALVFAAGGDAVARDAVTSAKRLITGKQIGKGTITARNVKRESLTGAQIRNGSVRGADVGDGSLTGADLASGSIALDRLAAQAIAALRGQKGETGPRGEMGPQGPQGPPGTNASINGVAAGGDLTGTYPNPELAPLTVGAAELGGNAIPADGSALNGSSKVATNAISSEEIADVSIQTADLGGGSVTSIKLGTDAVAADGTGTDGSTRVAASAIDADEIAAAGVGASELATNAVAQDGAVPNGSSKVATGAIGAEELNDNLSNTIGTDDIALGGVDDAELSDDLDDTVDSNDVSGLRQSDLASGGSSTVTIDLPSVAVDECKTVVPTDGAANEGELAIVTASNMPDDIVFIPAIVSSSAGSPRVPFRYCNVTGSTKDPPSQSYTVRYVAE